ncbi:MAG: bifunctional DNA-formamidopyrimidine glycosylase/DNA-(apurinic or apyrimidinic site) lyase [Bdellovibrionales bacterium]
MPELPEVETVKNGLIEQDLLGKRIDEVVFLRNNLRNTLPSSLPEYFKNAKILQISRRAKYILIHTEIGVLLSHLGMTGTWRFEEKIYSQKKHDHIEIHFCNKVLIYNDPRRFGFFDFFKLSDVKNKYLDHLGPEPLSSSFSAEYLVQKSTNRIIPIKNLIMDQKIVVGVGNIYACEALFRAGIRPEKKSCTMNSSQFELLVEDIKDVLNEALIAGGSTISDFKQAGGESGYFQNEFHVYGRESEPCYICFSEIQNISLGGRSSFYCKSCQK